MIFFVSVFQRILSNMWLKRTLKKKIILQDNVIKSTKTVQEELSENLKFELTEKEQSQRLNIILSLIAVTLLVNATLLVIITSVFGDVTYPCKDINSFQKHLKGKFFFKENEIFSMKSKYFIDILTYSSGNIDILYDSSSKSCRKV